MPLAFGNSQPATEMVVSALTGTPYDSGLDLDKLFEMAKYFEKVRQEGGWERGVTSLTHMQVYSHQVPGGMISNLESQLKEQSALDRLPEVLEEIPIVRAEVGFPPLVTPMSQIVGTQAVLNVLSGRRWHIVPDEMKQYLRGKYGAAPGPVSREVLSRVLEGEEPIGVRPADLAAPVGAKPRPEAARPAISMSACTWQTIRVSSATAPICTPRLRFHFPRQPWARRSRRPRSTATSRWRFPPARSLVTR